MKKLFSIVFSVDVDRKKERRIIEETIDFLSDRFNVDGLDYHVKTLDRR